MQVSQCIHAQTDKVRQVRTLKARVLSIIINSHALLHSICHKPSDIIMRMKKLSEGL